MPGRFRQPPRRRAETISRSAGAARPRASRSGGGCPRASSGRRGRDRRRRSVPMRWAPAPRGPNEWRRGRGPRADPGTIARKRPSHATYRGSNPSSSQAPRTSSRTGTADSSMRIPVREAIAISTRAVASPPASGVPQDVGLGHRRPRSALTIPTTGALSLVSAVSKSIPSRAAMTAMPWSPMGPDTRITSPAVARLGPT